MTFKTLCNILIDLLCRYSKIEFSSSLLILIDLVNGFILANQKKKYFLNILNIIDVITVIPIMLQYLMK